MRKYSNIGTDREALFLVRFGFFLASGQNRHHLKKKERKKQQERERENERERKRERKHEERPSTENTTTKAHHFLQREKTQKRDSLLSQHIMASREAAAILRELQGKNGNGVRF